MDASCQCGKVKFTTPTFKARALFICHCLECRAQSASAFGISAIFPHFSIPAANAPHLSSYTRPTESGKTLKCWFCKSCGTRLLHESFTPDGKSTSTVSVKGGCFGARLGNAAFGLDLADATHIWTKTAVIEVPVDAKSFEDDGPQDY